MKIRPGVPAMAVLLAGFAAGNAEGYSFVMPDDASLLRQADGAVVATVVGEPRAAAARGLPHVRHRLRVERTLAGKARHTLELELPGTVPGSGQELFAPGIPVLREGMRVLVFYNEEAHGASTPEQLTLGVFLEGKSGSGRRVYDRALQGADDLGKGRNARFGALRDAAAFENWVEASGRGMKLSADYLLPDEPSLKFTLAGSAFPDMLPSRWFAFQQGTTINWVATSDGLPGATFNTNTAITQALAAWTDDPLSDIRYAFTGTVASDPGNNSTNGVNAVIWNDPGADIGGSYNCMGGGTLAVGGSFSSSGTQSFLGNSYHPMVESFVIVQDGVACVFNGNGGNDGAETITHELGHTLGLGHSCGDGSSPACGPNPTLDDATMRASIHRDNRGAQIRTDDRAGAFFLYALPGGASTVFRNGFE